MINGVGLAHGIPFSVPLTAYFGRSRPVVRGVLCALRGSRFVHCSAAVAVPFQSVDGGCHVT